MNARLTRLRIKGLRTIYDSGDIYPGPITVLIGPNGAGKSNFVSFFRMMSYMLTPPGKLTEYVQLYGPASKILSDGQDVTQNLSGEIEIDTNEAKIEYTFVLTYAAGDRLVFTNERWRHYLRRQNVDDSTDYGAYVHQESALLSTAEDTSLLTPGLVRDLLRCIVVYQFHNTSPTARIRGQWDTHDGRYLKEDAANLAPVLLRLRDEQPEYYHRIASTIRRILPFFADFEFEPQARQQMLSWREHYSDRLFDASQAADGMLRVMALCTLLLLPEDNLPNVLVLDEPELGLHPFAIDVLGGLIRSLSTKVQIILATQSSALVDCFAPEDVLVVERSLPQNGVYQRGRKTVFRRLDTESLSEWLDAYTVSELWEKNVLGGKP